MDPTQVVRIFATTQEPDYQNPWQTHTPSSGTGSGVIIGPDRVLTGAHVVANATFLQVQTIFEPDKVVADVVAVCHDSDLALLRVRDPELFAEVEPAQLGELPEQSEHVSVVGFPVGGEEVSITEGVVSRIEVQRYTHSQRDLLAITVDAAINEGNSGGPVYLEDRVVGIAFQSLDDAENIGEAVPAPLIRRFLAGVDEGRPLDVPGFGLVMQNLENPTLRRHLGVPEGTSGVLVNAVEYSGSAWGVVQPGDVMMEVAGAPVSNSGTVRHDGVRTRLGVVMGERFVGDELPVTLWRDGARVEAAMTLRASSSLVPGSRYEIAPSYFVFGGLVFQPLSRDFLVTWGPDWREHAPAELVSLYRMGLRTEARHASIVLGQVLAHDLNVGYGELYWDTVEHVNGQVPRDLPELIRLVEATTGTLEIAMTNKGRAILDMEQARAANPEILQRYQVPRDRSV